MACICSSFKLNCFSTIPFLRANLSLLKFFSANMWLCDIENFTIQICWLKSVDILWITRACTYFCFFFAFTSSLLIFLPIARRYLKLCFSRFKIKTICVISTFHKIQHHFEMYVFKCIFFIVNYVFSNFCFFCNSSSLLPRNCFSLKNNWDSNRDDCGKENH